MSFIMNRCFLFLFVSCMMLSCEKPYIPDGSDDNPSVVQPDDVSGEHGDTLIAVNDTARFYLSGMEISGVMLQDYPTPSTLLAGSHYRLPRRLEVSQVLKSVDMPEGYWNSKQRILCYDYPQDDGIKVGSTLFGSGYYYTYVPHGNITRAGYQTQYCLLPIRTARLPKQDGHVDITVDDEWK